MILQATLDSLKQIEDYDKLLTSMQELTAYEKIKLVRELSRRDLFFLMWFTLGRKDMYHPWLLERCKEVQKNPDFHLDLWARGHYKSSIITFGKTIQDILASHGEDPLEEWGGKEPTFGIFSCTRPIAKQFLAQIKREFEQNEVLLACFDDILWANPDKEASKWSEEAGIIVKRKGNTKEATVEAWGCVQGQPTSKHFDVLVFDDMVTIENVRSPDMIRKTTDSWSLALNLGAEKGKVRYIGTRYHFNDTYKTMIERNAVIPRIHPITIDGTADGEPVLLTREEVKKKREQQGPFNFACQLLLNPVAEDSQGFKPEWFQYHDAKHFDNMNIYITVDPANEKKRTSDYTVMFVIGLAEDENYYILDMLRDRLSLTERADRLFRLHRQWRPMCAGYEKYGMQADLEFVQYKMNQENYRFPIKALGGQLSKVDRIRKLIPYFEQGRILFPQVLHYVDYEKKTRNLTQTFFDDEYVNFPLAEHDDMLDALARILDADLGAVWPTIVNKDEKVDRYALKYNSTHSSSCWAD